MDLAAQENDTAEKHMTEKYLGDVAFKAYCLVNEKTGKEEIVLRSSAVKGVLVLTDPIDLLEVKSSLAKSYDGRLTEIHSQIAASVEEVTTIVKNLDSIKSSIGTIKDAVTGEGL